MNNTNDDTTYALSGTGCNNIFELRLAYDTLRNYMHVKYGDNWDARRVAELVSKELYANAGCCGQGCCGQSENCSSFAHNKCPRICEGAD